MEFITGYVTVDEFAERLQVHPNTVYKLIHQGLPTVDIGRRAVRIVCPTADAWLKDQAARTRVKKTRKTKRRE